MKMNKSDSCNNQLNIGDIVVLCDCLEAISREFSFYEVTNDGAGNTAFIANLNQGSKKECFSVDKLKKVDSGYKKMIDKATSTKVKNSGERVPFSYYCPSCLEELSDDCYKHDDYLYCPYCGQKLDWGN